MQRVFLILGEPFRRRFHQICLITEERTHFRSVCNVSHTPYGFTQGTVSVLSNQLQLRSKALGYSLLDPYLLRASLGAFQVYIMQEPISQITLLPNITPEAQQIA